MIITVWLCRTGPVWAGVHQGYIYSAFNTRADQLKLACLLAFSLRLPALQRFLGEPLQLACLSRLIVTVFVGSNVLQYRFGAVYRGTIGFAVEGVAAALLIPLEIRLRANPAWAWLNLSLVCYLSRISRSIYLYQQITPGIVRTVALVAASDTFMLMDIVVLVVVASASYRFIEQPLLKLKDRFVGGAKGRHLRAQPQTGHRSSIS